eukprot:UN06094
MKLSRQKAVSVTPVTEKKRVHGSVLEISKISYMDNQTANQTQSGLCCECKLINELNSEKQKIGKDILNIMTRLGLLGTINIVISMFCIFGAVYLNYMLDINALILTHDNDNTADSRCMLIPIILYHISCVISVTCTYLSFAYTNKVYHTLCSKCHQCSQLFCVYCLVKNTRNV